MPLLPHKSRSLPIFYFTLMPKAFLFPTDNLYEACFYGYPELWERGIFSEEDLKQASKEDLPVWLWSLLAAPDSFTDLPPDLMQGSGLPLEAVMLVAEAKATVAVPNKEKPFFRFVPIETQLCANSKLSFCESLATAYAWILEGKSDKIFLQGNNFSTKVAKAVFENNKNLFISTCEKKNYKDEYFAGYSLPLEEHGNSWGNIFDEIRFLTEECLVTRLEDGLPTVEVSEFQDNSDSENGFRIILTPHSTHEDDVNEANLVRLDIESSGSSLDFGKRFHDFLNENFHCRGNNEKFIKFMSEVFGEEVCNDITDYSLPLPNVKIKKLNEGELGYHKDGTVYISESLAFESFNEEKQKDCFALLVILLHEYGSFLNYFLHKNANKPENNSKRASRIFARLFMKYSKTDLFNEGFVFADAKDRREHSFAISNLIYSERKEIYIYTRYHKYAGTNDFKISNYKDKNERKVLHEKSKLSVTKGNHLWKTLLDYHYGQMLDKLNGMDAKLDTDKEFEEAGYLLRALWRKYESGLRVHNTKVNGGKHEKYMEEHREIKNNASFNKEKNNTTGEVEWGICVDLVYDTFLKAWTRAYQGTFHEFFHNIDYLVEKRIRNISSNNILLSYSAGYSYFAEAIASDVKNLRKAGKLEEIHNLDKYAKAFLCDIIGGVLYYDSFRYGCHICPKKAFCKVDIEIDTCTEKYKFSYGHKPDYWLFHSVMPYLMSEDAQRDFFGNINKNEAIESLAGRFEYGDREKVMEIFKKFAEIANIKDYTNFTSIKEFFENIPSIDKTLLSYCIDACANIAAKAAITESKDSNVGKIREYSYYRLAFETFANMASAAVVNPIAFQAMKKYLPETYETFINILENMILI
jgi:hypothetical protein